MKAFQLKVLALLLFATIASAQENNSKFNAFLDAYYDESSLLNPVGLTARGDNRFNDKMPNIYAAAHRKKSHDFNVRYQKKLYAFDRNSLNASERISFDMIDNDIKDTFYGEQFHMEYIPFDQRGGLPLFFPSMGSGSSIQPFKTVKDYENWLKRVAVFTVCIDTAIANFDKGIARGLVLPKTLVVKMIPQMEAQMDADTLTNLFYKPILNLPSEFSVREKIRLRKAYQKAISSQIIPAYAKLAAYLKNTYLPNARETSGYNHLPNGEALYRFLVKDFTTTSLTPDEIHQLGLREVARITTEIEKLKTKIGFNGTISELFDHVLTAKEFFPFKNEEEILQAYRDILPRIEPNLKKLFNLVPKSAFEVKAVEKFRAGSASASYSRGTADGSRPGYFMVPILDPMKYNSVGMENLFLHEAIPGHHYQLSLQQENKSLSKMRQYASYSVFSEGWALYVESLGEALGVYTNPYQKLGAYKSELFRAMRLVVDTGMHTGKMTREESITYLMEKGGSEEKKAISETERYLSNPAQALTYKVGELKIQEIKSKCQQKLGEKFDIRKFHDAVLEVGSVPLYAFESYMEQWVNEQLN